jgi:uncharacterized alpha-E superfamily protein
MLSRVAERVYWLARYLERAENTARLMNVYSNLLLDFPRGTKIGWHTLIDVAGVKEEFGANERVADERAVVKFLLADNNGQSILSMLSMVRENARTTREIIPSEAFEQINNLYLHTKENAAPGLSRGPRNRLLEEIIVGCQQLNGLLTGSLSHNHVHRFLRIGRCLERADMTTRIVEVGSVNLLPNMSNVAGAEDEALKPYQDTMWMSVLRSLSAYQMYRQHVQDRVNGKNVVEYLLQDEQFPRALSYCLIRVENCLLDLTNNKAAVQQVARTLRKGQRANITKLVSEGLFEYIDDLQIEIAKIHVQIARTWFLPQS